MMPTLRQLEYAVAVAGAKNFSDAARTCQVTQPGLSTQIRLLEETLGVQLFERNAQRVLVTPAGEDVVETARRVLIGVSELVACAQGHSDPLVGTIRLGVIPTIAPYLLPRAMPDIRRHLSALRLLIREDQTARLVRLIDRGELDVLLVALESELGDLETLSLGQDAFLAAVSCKHRLAKRKRLNPSDLKGEEILLLDDGHCLREQTSSICDAAGACELGDFRATSLGTLIQMVSNGVGITLLPTLATRDRQFDRERIKLLPFTNPKPTRTIALAWRSSSPHREAFETLGRLFANSIA